MPNAKAPRIRAEDWNCHKSRIHDLYISQGSRLSEVKRIVEVESGFKATDAQWGRQLKKWQFNKYVNDAEEQWKYIHHMLNSRQSQGKRSVVSRHGCRLSEEQVKKELKRYTFQTVFDRLDHGPVPPSPDHRALAIRTPSPFSSPSPCSLILSVDGRVQIRSESEFTISSMPSFLNPYYSTSWQHGALHFDFISHVLPDLQRFFGFTPNLSLSASLQDEHRTAILYSELPGLLFLLLKQMPEMSPGRHLQASTMTSRGDPSFILEIMAFAIANKIEALQPDDQNLINALHRSPADLLWLKRLRESVCPQTQALFEAFFASSLKVQDVAMVGLLLKAGADPNKAINVHNIGWFCFLTPLGIAAYFVNRQLIDLLSDHNATYHQPKAPFLGLLATMARHQGGCHSTERYKSCVNAILLRYTPSDDEISAATQSACRSRHTLARVLLRHVSLKSMQLMYALSCADQDMVISLVGKVTLKNVEFEFAYPPLQALLQSNGLADDWKLSSVQIMLSHGLNPNAWCHYFGGTRPLKIAIDNRMFEIANILLDHGAQSEKKELAAAVRVGHLQLVSRVLQNMTTPTTCEIWSRDKDKAFDESRLRNWTLALDLILKRFPEVYDPALLLQAAVVAYTTGDANNYVAFQTVLARRSKCTHTTDRHYEGTAFALAIFHSDAAMVQKLIDYHVSPFTHTVWLRPPSKLLPDGAYGRFIADGLPALPSDVIKEAAGILSFAVSLGHQGVVKYLLDNGVRPDGDALTYAMRLGRSDLIDTLVRCGAYLDDQGLVTAVDKDRLDLVNIMIHQGTDLDLCLQHACVNENSIAVQRLLGLGAKSGRLFWNRFVMADRTAFQAAVEAGNIEVVELLLARGTDINEKPAHGSSRGATALQLAALKGQLALAKRLLELGADYNAPASETHGRTALEGAAEYGRLEMLKLLLSKQILTTGSGQRQYIRAVMLAREEGHNAAAEFLKGVRPWTVQEDEILAMKDTLSYKNYSDSEDEGSYSTEPESEDEEDHAPCTLELFAGGAQATDGLYKGRGRL